MITVIVGLPGAGKTSLMQAIHKEIITEHGREILKKCKAKIDEYNRERLYPLSYPEKVPTYSNIRNCKFHVGYKKYYTPYKLEPEKFGIASEKFTPQYFPPFSRLFIDEAERFFDAHGWASLKKETARAFEEHRQYGLDVYLIFHKAPQADISIKNTVGRIYLLQSQRHNFDKAARITSTTWTFLQFNSFDHYIEYLKGGQYGEQKTKTYVGNIFETFDSYSYGKDFLPSDVVGKNFNFE